MSKSVLIIAHAPSPNTRALAEAALAGASDPDAGAVSATLTSPFDVTAPDLFAADAVLIGTTENIGYMAGATKDLFDRCYNDWLGASEAKPVAVYIRAGLDGTATRRALESIIGAQRWRLVAPPLILHGAWSASYVGEVRDLAMGLAAGLDAGIF
ncbi:MAG: flavodoxin family protein [Candidatus Puniceispirillaceae bacterium]